MIARQSYEFKEGEKFDGNHEMYHFIEDLLLEHQMRRNKHYPRVKADTMIRITIVQLLPNKVQENIPALPNWMKQPLEKKQNLALEVYS